MKKDNSVILTKFLMTIGLLLVTAMIAYSIPRTSYKGTGVLKQVSLPDSVGSWQGYDVPPQTVNLENPNANYINQVKIRKYVQAGGAVIYLSLFDAGNFHNPKTCFVTSGYTAQELKDIEVTTTTGSFEVPAIFFDKPKEHILLAYWMTINGKRVNFTQQKFQDLLFALKQKTREGVIVRLDVPIVKEGVEVTAQMAKEFLNIYANTLNSDQAAIILGQ